MNSKTDKRVHKHSTGALSSVKLHRSIHQRKADGNMLFLSVAMGAVILVLVGLAFWLHLTFFSNQLLQDSSEKVVLQAAQRLNANDNAGKLNNLTVNSRELVFAIRQMHDKAAFNPELQEYQQLAAHLVEQARLGASTVSDERQRFVNSTISDLRKLAKAPSKPFGREIALFNATVDQPRVIKLSVGSLDNMDSNVEASAGIPELTAYDSNHQFLKRGKHFDFYRARNKLKLPSPDDDLNFELSPLPVVVDGTAAPMRLVSDFHFKPSMVLLEDGNDTIGSCSTMPSCVQIMMTVNMKSKVATQLESGTQTLLTACTNGALREPE